MISAYQGSTRNRHRGGHGIASHTQKAANTNSAVQAIHFAVNILAKSHPTAINLFYALEQIHKITALISRINA